MMKMPNVGKASTWVLCAILMFGIGKMLRDTAVVSNAQKLVHQFRDAASSAESLKYDKKVATNIIPDETTVAQNSEDSKGVLPVPSDYSNNTRLIIYNAIPKCGATTTVQLFQRFGRRSGRYYGVYGLHSVSQETYVRTLTNMTRTKERPVLLAAHHEFIPFERFDLVTPPHVQLMREPVAQAISYYQFLVSRKRVPRHEAALSIEECLSSLEQCPELQHVLYNHTILHHYCGRECMNNLVSAVNQAKENIVKHHSVVGVTENITQFYELLEYMHPHHFAGLTKTYRNEVRNRGRVKKVWPERVIERLEKQLWADTEVYKFVKKRFHLLHEAMETAKSENVELVKGGP